MANFEHVLKMCTESLPALNLGMSFQSNVERNKLVENNSIKFLICYLAKRCALKHAETETFVSVSCRIFPVCLFLNFVPFQVLGNSNHTLYSRDVLPSKRSC